MAYLEQREVREFTELMGNAMIMVAKSSFSLSKFYSLMDALRRFVQNASPDDLPT